MTNRMVLGLLALIAAPILSSCGSTPEPITGTVMKLDFVAAHAEEETFCNGDPVLLICDEEMVDQPAWYGVTIAYPETVKRKDGGYDGEGKSRPCRVELTAEEFKALTVGDEVVLDNSYWNGCKVLEWPEGFPSTHES